MVGNIRLTITLDNERCVRHTVAAPAADKVYYLSNLYFTIETLDIQDGIFSELHRKYLESGNVYEIPFTNYFTYTANTANVKFNLSTQSLDAVYGTAFTSTATALANVNNNGETIQASIFTRQAVAAATHQFNVNGTFYPTYRVPSEDVFAWNVQELATAQDLVS